MKEYEKKMLEKWSYLNWALNTLEENNYDVDLLKKKCKQRGVLGYPINISNKEMQEHFEYIKDNTMTTVLTCILYALHESEGFGGKRLKRVQEAFRDVCRVIMDIDYMGEYYCNISDIAIELNDKYNVGLDINLLQGMESEAEQKQVHLVAKERIVQELMQAGYKDAGDWLSKR